MNRRDVVKSAVALALYGPFAARARIFRTGNAKSTVVPQAQSPTSTPFPRTAMIATAGAGSGYDQTYSPVPYSSQVTKISGEGMFASGTYGGGQPVAWMGRFDLVLIGGDWEGWDESGKFDRGLLVDAIKQITDVSGYDPAYVFQYVIEEVFITPPQPENPFNTWYPTIVSENWGLFNAAGDTGGSSNYVSTGGSIGGYTAYETNWAVAWPNGRAGAAQDQCYSKQRTTAHYNDGPEDMPQYSAAYFIETFVTRHSSFSGVVSGTIAASAYTDPRFYPTLASGANDDQMKAPNVDGFQLDNVFAYPRESGYYDLVTNYPGDNDGTYWNSPAGPWMVRGAQHFFSRFQQIMAEAYPSRAYYNFCNFAAWDQVHAKDTGGIFSAMSNGLSGTMHGGVLESEIGAPSGIEAQYGWSALLSFYNAMMDFCLAPKLLVMGTQISTPSEYQQARYCLCSTLMDDGFCQIATNGSYRVDDYIWLDEFGGTPGTNIAKGWLGQRVGSRPAAAAVNGVWIAEFDHGVAIVNPGDNSNGEQTITAAQINAYLGGSYTFEYIKGVQDTTTNPGGAFSQATIAKSDGLLLLKTGGTGQLTVTLQGSWDSGVATGVSTQSVVRNSQVNAGDLLVVCVIGNQDNNVTSVTDGQFGTLTFYSGAENWDSGNSNWMQFFWAVAGQGHAGSGSNKVTASFSSSTSKAEVIVAQFRCSSGYLFESSPLGACVSDGPQADPGTGAGAIASGSTNFGYEPMLAFAASFDETGSGGQTVATSGWSSGFTASSGKLVPAWKVITSTGYQQMGWTASSTGGSDTYQAMLVGLKIAANSVAVAWSGDTGSSGTTPVSSVTLSRSVAAQKGDLLVVWASTSLENGVSSVKDSGAAFGSLTASAASAWDSVDTNWGQLWWKVATEADTGGTITVDFTAAAKYSECVGGLFRPTGASFGGNAGAGGQVVSNVAPGGTVSTPSVTPSSYPALALAYSQDIIGNAGGQKINGGWNAGPTGNVGGGATPFMISAFTTINSGAAQETWTTQSNDGTSNYNALLLAIQLEPS